MLKRIQFWNEIAQISKLETKAKIFPAQRIVLALVWQRCFQKAKLN